MFTWLGRMIEWYQSWFDSLNIRWLSQGACWTTSFYQRWSYRWLQTIGHGYIQVKGTRRDKIFFREKTYRSNKADALFTSQPRYLADVSVEEKTIWANRPSLWSTPSQTTTYNSRQLLLCLSQMRYQPAYTMPEWSPLLILQVDHWSRMSRFDLRLYPAYAWYGTQRSQVTRLLHKHPKSLLLTVQSSTCKPGGKVSVTTMAGDMVFLTWTCSDCQQLEILL